LEGIRVRESELGDVGPLHDESAGGCSATGLVTDVSRGGGAEVVPARGDERGGELGAGDRVVRRVVERACEGEVPVGGDTDMRVQLVEETKGKANGDDDAHVVRDGSDRAGRGDIFELAGCGGREIVDRGARGGV